MDGNNGGKYTAQQLVARIRSLWSGTLHPFVVFTGGEPLLQLDAALIEACKAANIEISIETNGTQPVPKGIDWVCVSPKPRSKCIVQSGSELKLIYPQEEEEMHPKTMKQKR